MNSEGQVVVMADRSVRRCEQLTRINKNKTYTLKKGKIEIYVFVVRN